MVHILEICISNWYTYQNGKYIIVFPNGMVKCRKASFSLPNNRVLVLFVFHCLILLPFLHGKQRQTIKQTVDGLEYTIFPSFNQIRIYMYILPAIDWRAKNLWHEIHETHTHFLIPKLSVEKIHSFFPSRCRCVQLSLWNTNDSFSVILCLVDISYSHFLSI